MTLDEFNALDEAQAYAAVQRCCVSERWIRGMLQGRPFGDVRTLQRLADEVWGSLSEADYLEAFEGHPKIGDVNSLKAKYAASAGLAAHEQSGVSKADDALIGRLAAGNKTYLERFGFIFIVCATGKTALEMCELLEARLDNGRDEELAIAAEEQRKILQIRLEKIE